LKLGQTCKNKFKMLFEKHGGDFCKAMEEMSQYISNSKFYRFKFLDP